MKTRTSINHLTSKEQNALHCIKKKIVEHLSPLLIFCFNSNTTQTVNRSCFSSNDRSEEWSWSCGLLIVIPNEATIDSDTKKEIEEFGKLFGKLNIFIHPLDFVVQQLKEENLFFGWVRCIGMVLYDKNDSLSLLPTPISNYHEYQHQAEQFYFEDPQFERYLEKKIIPISRAVADNNKQSVVERDIMDKSIKRIVVDLEKRMGDPPQQLYPQNLSPEEIVNPYLVVNSFFREFDLQSAKEYISGWMTDLYEEVNMTKKDPSNLVFFFDRLFRLVEAGWLINQMDNSKRLGNLSLQFDLETIDLMNPGFYCKKPDKESSWDDFPRNLNKADYINPYDVFPKVFKFHSLNEWKDGLRNILHLALSNYDMEDTGEAINTLGCTKHLDELVEACYLINVREFEWSNKQLFLKIYNETATEGKE